MRVVKISSGAYVGVTPGSREGRRGRRSRNLPGRRFGTSSGGRSVPGAQIRAPAAAAAARSPFGAAGPTAGGSPISTQKPPGPRVPTGRQVPAGVATPAPAHAARLPATCSAPRATTGACVPKHAAPGQSSFRRKGRACSQGWTSWAPMRNAAMQRCFVRKALDCSEKCESPAHRVPTIHREPSCGGPQRGQQCPAGGRAGRGGQARVCALGPGEGGGGGHPAKFRTVPRRATCRRAPARTAGSRQILPNWKRIASPVSPVQIGSGR